MADIVYASDDKFYKMLKCSINSIVNTIYISVHFHIISDNISAENIKDLESFVIDSGNQISVYDLKQLDMTDLVKLRLSKDWPIVAMARLHIEKIIPESINQILYLDCDTLIMKDISDLFQVKYLEKPLYGVLDCMDNTYKKRISLSLTDIYVNSGVLLYNLDFLRKNDFSTKIDNIIAKHANTLKYPDQDVINIAFKNNIGILPMKYNVISQIFPFTLKQYQYYRNSKLFYDYIEFNNSKIEPIILHFTSGFAFARPWYKDSMHPFRQSFRDQYVLANKELEYWGNDNRSRIQRIIAKCNSLSPNFSIFFLKILRRVNNK